MIAVQSRSCQYLSERWRHAQVRDPAEGSVVPSLRTPPPASPGPHGLCRLGPGSTAESGAEGSGGPQPHGCGRSPGAPACLVHWESHVARVIASSPRQGCLGQSSATETWVPVRSPLQPKQGLYGLVLRWPTRLLLQQWKGVRDPHCWDSGPWSHTRTWGSRGDSRSQCPRLPGTALHS